jgi:multidrug efflux pump subunit AcrA (membrane-fusion protein)
MHHGLRETLFRPLKTLVLWSVLLGLQGCSGEGQSSPPVERSEDRIKKVKVASVRARPLEGSVEQVGTLCAALKVDVSAEMGGTLEKILFERGGRVKQGGVLAEVGTASLRIEVRQAEAALLLAQSQLKKVETGSRPEEILIARAGLEQAKATLEEARNNFERIKDLYGDRAVSESTYDGAKRAVDTAHAHLDSARQQLALAEQGPRVEDRAAARARVGQARANLAMAKDRLRKSVLRAPCDGVAAFRRVEVGEVVAAGTVITQIVHTGEMKIVLSLGEQYIPVLARQKKFPFTVDAIAQEEFIGRLTFLSPTSDQATRAFPIELSVEDPDPRMADGMTARVRFPLADSRKSIRVPSAWLSEQNGVIGLFVIEDGKAVFKEVVLGSYYEHKVEILSGLGDAARVITNPAGLKSGDPVQH